MSEDNLDRFERLLGKPARNVNGVYWREVRPGFYRPLAQFRIYSAEKISLPKFAFLGAAQYAVESPKQANSALNCICFENTGEYSVAHLDQNRNRQVRLATKQFTIRPVVDLEEFKRDGHSAYLSFFERTRYEYGAKRVDPSYFARWADSLFQLPAVRILGGYRGEKLEGISLSFLLSGTLCYASFFCTTDAMKQYLSDLMLHAVRTAAAKLGSINEIYAGMYKGNTSLDRFYLLRGAKCIQKPARLHINPLLKPVLQYGAPKMYAKLTGRLVESSP